MITKYIRVIIDVFPFYYQMDDEKYRGSRDRMVVGFIFSYHYCCEFRLHIRD